MVESEQGQTRPLGFWSLLALGLNGIIGVGIFLTPNRVAALVPGAAGSALYVLTALALTPVACVYATLGSHFDEDGGPYVWARAAFGPSFGFAVGWIAYVSALFSTSAIVVGLVENAGPSVGVSGALGMRLAGVGIVALLSSTVATGLRPSAVTWSALTVLKLVPLALLAGAFVASAAPPPGVGPSPIATADVRAAVLIIVFAFQGFEIVPVPRGHARAGARAVPAATLLCLAGAAVLYVLLHAACVRGVPSLASSRAPLVAAGAAYGGRWLASLVAAGTNLSAIGIAFGMFAMTPRYLAALGRQDALGESLVREDVRRVPRTALALTSLAIAGLVAAGELSELFVLSSIAVLTQYGVSAAALAVLAARRRRGLRRTHIWPAPLAVVAVVLVGAAADSKELYVAAAALAVGGALLVARRWFVARRREQG
jgi:amino acid transporter